MQLSITCRSGRRAIVTDMYFEMLVGLAEHALDGRRDYNGHSCSRYKYGRPTDVAAEAKLNGLEHEEFVERRFYFRYQSVSPCK